MKYCCDNFLMHLKSPNGTVPNIRMIKYLPFREGESLYGFFVTAGYDKFDIIYTPKIPITYCPYCGSNLKKIYSNDDFVNEIEGETF